MPALGPGRIRAIVVDDEPLARSSISVLLRTHADIELIAECGSGEEAIAEIRRSKPDLVFLDVQMPECDGFDVLEMLGGDLPQAVIFVTAYDQYALRAFEAGALDYLLKPFDNARFERALDRARQQLAGVRAGTPRVHRFAVKAAGNLVFIKVGEIDWIEAADYYACLHAGGKSHLIRRSMSDLERELEPAFCRIHRSAIVNLDRVRALQPGSEGDYEVKLDNGETLPLSRRYRKELQARLGVRTRR